MALKKNFGDELRKTKAEVKKIKDPASRKEAGKLIDQLIATWDAEYSPARVKSRGRKLGVIGKQVLDTKTNTRYDSISAAARAEGVEATTLRSYLNKNPNVRHSQAVRDRLSKFVFI